MTVPTFLRPELWHPLSVHFPIALLLLATIVKGMALLVSKSNLDFWQKVGTFLLLVGTAGVWLAVFTGDTAEGVVARKICDPILLKQHEQNGLVVAWLFTGAAALQFLLYQHFLKPLWRIIRPLVLLLMLVGSGFLVYTSHLGAQVVYEQGGGVNMPSADCKGI